MPRITADKPISAPPDIDDDDRRAHWAVIRAIACEGSAYRSGSLPHWVKDKNRTRQR